MSKRVFAIFAAAYLLTLLVTAPASLLGKGLEYVTQGRVVLANAGGTLWSGAGIPALRTTDGRLVELPFVSWKVETPSLLGGKIRVALQWGGLSSAPVTEAVIHFDRVELNHAQLQLPARLLGEAATMLKPIQLGGQLQMQGEHLVFSKRGMDGAAVIDWRQASSALSTINPLGDYRLALNGAGDRIHIGLSTTSGALLLDGDGNWQVGKGVEFHGKAQASSANGENLAELLQHLGPEIAPGVHGFNLTPQ